MTSNEFKKIQKRLGFKNKEMARALATSVRSVENWRGEKCRIPGPAIIALYCLMERKGGSS